MSDYRRSRGTTVPVERTQAQIIKLLRSIEDPSGEKISWGFDNSDCSLLIHYAGINFRVRVNIDAKFERIKREYKRTPLAGWDKVREQAEREAWRNLVDLLKLNITMINEGQFRFTDLFLSFVQIPGPEKKQLTLGDYFLEKVDLPALSSGQKRLPEPKE